MERQDGDLLAVFDNEHERKKDIITNNEREERASGTGGGGENVVGSDGGDEEREKVSVTRFEGKKGCDISDGHNNLFSMEGVTLTTPSVVTRR